MLARPEDDQDYRLSKAKAKTLAAKTKAEKFSRKAKA